MPVVKFCNRHWVQVATKSEGVLEIELLLNSEDLYGTETVYGSIFKPSKEALLKALRWIYDVNEVKVIRTTLVP